MLGANIMALLLASAGLIADPAFAERPIALDRVNPPVEEAGCHLENGGESTVISIAGPQTLHLADGRFIRLAEILVPPMQKLGFDPSAGAVNYLKTVALGKKVEVKYGGAVRDRYGVYIAHIFVAADTLVWLQKGLVESGYAQAFPQPDNHSCARQLLNSEARAREEKRGHWGLAFFKVMRARESRALLNLLQTYQIVEGRVDHASESGGRLTIHFRPEGQYEFAANIEPAVRKRLPNLQATERWQGQYLRIRGWLDRKKGPMISVTLPEQIEFL